MLALQERLERLVITSRIVAAPPAEEPVNEAEMLLAAGEAGLRHPCEQYLSFQRLANHGISDRLITQLSP